MRQHSEGGESGGDDNGSELDFRNLLRNIGNELYLELHFLVWQRLLAGKIKKACLWEKGKENTFFLHSILIKPNTWCQVCQIPCQQLSGGVSSEARKLHIEMQTQADMGGHKSVTSKMLGKCRKGANHPHILALNSVERKNGEEVNHETLLQAGRGSHCL